MKDGSMFSGIVKPDKTNHIPTLQSLNILITNKINKMQQRDEHVKASDAKT